MKAPLHHPWHFIPHNFSNDEVTAIIEIPMGSKAKYEIDKNSGMLMLDRVLHASMFYPANYGFIPQSFCDDGDPLDILVLSQLPFQPLCLVRAKVIGVMQMLDNEEADDKIIAVATNDPAVNHIQDADALPIHLKNELRHFFMDYTKLENKKVVVDAIAPKQKAIQIIDASLQLYKEAILPSL